MGLRLVTAPEVEPVTLQEARLHLRLITDPADVSAHPDDGLISTLISAAREYAESECRRVFITQQWLFALDAFPLYSYSGTYNGYVPGEQQGWGISRNYAVRVHSGRIDIPFPRLQTVESIKYIDASGVLQTLSPLLYVVDSISEPGAITPAPGTYWPTTQNVLNAVQISFTAGYGLASAVPTGVKAWVLLRLGAMYENREEIVVGARIVSVDLPFVASLLNPYRVLSYS